MTTDVSKNRTVIGADCHIRGELWLENDLLMMGQVDGTLQVMGLLDLPASAHVEGRVMCTTLRLAGRIEAEVLAEESVELLPGAFLSGKLYTPKLLVHEGATLEAAVYVGPNALARANEMQELIPEKIDDTAEAHPAAAPSISPVITPANPSTSTDFDRQPIVTADARRESPLSINQAPDTDTVNDPLRGEPVVSTVHTVADSLRNTLGQQRPRLPRVLKGGVIQP